MAASQLRNLIYYHLDNDLLDTANFLADRLLALDSKSADASHLLALTHLRLRRFKPACDAAQKYGATGRHLGCAYVFAQACLHLDRSHDGIQALEKARALWQGKSSWTKHTETSRRHLPDAVAVQTLLAKLWHAHGDFKKAGEYYAEVHKTSPFTWEAFAGLCNIGADLNMAHTFQPTQEMGIQPHTETSAASTAAHGSHISIFTPTHDPFSSTTHGQEVPNLVLPGKQRLGRKQASSDWDTPTTGGHTVSDEDGIAMDEDRHPDPPQAPGRRAHNIGDVTVHADDVPRKTTFGTLKRTISGHPPQALSANSDPPSNPRRSNRLFGQGTTARSNRTAAAADAALSLASRTERDTRPARNATGAKGRAATTVGRVVSGNRKILPPDPADKEKEKLKRVPNRITEKTIAPVTTQPVATAQKASSALPIADQTAVCEVLDNLKRLALGSYAASRFDLTQAIQAYRALPATQRETPWVLAQLGKAYHEMADYQAAEDCFARLMKLQPARIEDIEVYSTVLWHLKKDTALALLCHSCRDQHYDAPQTWCVIGNTFSLAREHDQAISAFRRATQLDPKFAYAWVLMGHEYIANEEYDAALYAFRKGVAADRRGFGGWYGLGKSLERMGKFEDAERHYRIAASINPSNATLLVCIGVVLEKLRNKKSALLQYTRALQLAPNSALARFKKARVLMHLRSFDQALLELEVLRDQAPDEANVWFLLGKCYKGLGDRGDALRAFTTALNLDAKASPFIREAMETLDEDYDDEGESEDD